MTVLLGVTVAALVVVALGAVAALVVVVREHRQAVGAVVEAAAQDRLVLVEAIVARHSGDLARTRAATAPPAAAGYLAEEARLRALVSADPDMPVVPEGL